MRPLVVTEGKTDWKHLKSALDRLQKAGRFRDLDVEFLEYEDEVQMGDTELLKMCRAYSKAPQERVTVFIFDRDNASILGNVQSGDGRCKDWGNRVFSFALPIPSHRCNDPEISVELYYRDSEITRADLRGRRLFLNTEFNPNSGLHRSESLHCMALTKIHRPIVTIIDDQVFDRMGANVALSKNDFADYVLNGVLPFDNLDVSEFAQIFSLVAAVAATEPSNVDVISHQVSEVSPLHFWPVAKMLDVVATYSWRLPRWERIFGAIDEEQDGAYVNLVEVHDTVRSIENTLRSFGIPAYVVAIDAGPVFDQYSLDLRARDANTGHTVIIDPEEIQELKDDLTLATAQEHSIQIQFPIPNRPYLLALLVEKRDKQVVHLSQLARLTAVRPGTRTTVALGQFVDGSPAVFDLVDFPHLLITGWSKAGKSVCVDSIITCLLLKNTPAQLKLILVDPIGVEFVYFCDVPHSLSPVVTTGEAFLSVIQWVEEEIGRRTRLFSARNVRNIADFNAEPLTQEPLPLVLIVINELPQLLVPAASTIWKRIIRILQASHRVGIHVISVAHSSQVKEMTDLLKACRITRIAFRVATPDDSIAVVGATGAEQLLGAGDMLLSTPGEPALRRIQGSYVTDEEVRRIADYWCRASPLMVRNAGVQDRSISDSN